MNTLTCRPDASGGYDFVIDGVFLNEMISGPPPKTGSGGSHSDGRGITLLRRSLASDVVLGQLRRLRGEEPGDCLPDRVWLYFCPMCFGENDGGINVRISHSADTVTWSDFRYDDPEQPEESGGPDDPDPEELALEFSFAREPYLAALNMVERALFSGPALAGRHGELALPRLGLERLTTRAWLRKNSKPRGPQWTIDGAPLSRILAAADTGSLISDEEYSMLLAEGADPVHLAAVMLGREPDRDLPGRIPLLVGECLHRECGQITARLTRTETTVTWDDFRLIGPGGDDAGESLGRPVTLSFDAWQYDRVVAAIGDRPG